MTTATLNGQNTPASFVAEAMAKDAARRNDPAQAVPGSAPNWGQYPIPHVLSFQSIFGSLAKVYRPTDEAIRNSLDNARYMRNDCGIMECVESRQRAVALLDWHLEPEDETSQEQKDLCADLTKIIRRIKRFTDYRYNLLHALWYGRYAVQHQYRWTSIGGQMRILPYPDDAEGDGAGWLPVNGDKLVFRYDDGRYQQGDRGYPGQVGIRVGGQWKPTDKINGRWDLEFTDRGMAYFLEPWERRIVAIHKHMIEDGAFEAGIDAGMIHGVGIRSRIYWDWFQKQEALAFLMEYLERSAGGIELWYYDEGNPQSKAKTEQAATERIGNKRNVILVPRPRGEDGMAYGVQVIEPGMAGIESLKDILTNYYGHRIKRYILGQTLTSEAEATGLGSGVADAHLDTFMMIVRYDARGLDETITDQLVRHIKDWNFPWAKGIHIRYKTETEAPDLEKRLDGWQRAYEMGCRLKESDVMDLIGAEMPKETDRVLQHPQFTQQPGMGGPGGMPGGPSGGPGGGPGNGPVGPGGGLHPKTVAVAMQASEETARALFGDVSNPDADTGERVKEKSQYAKSADEAAAETDRNPSDEQKASGNFRKGRFRLHGLSIAIETPKGAERRGTNRAGQDWSVTLPVHYGYIHRTEGRDGDHVDCFIGPNPESEIVYVVDQTTPGGRFDEHKCLLGFTTSEQAAEAYLGSYADDASKRIRDVTPMTIDQFKAWLEHGDLRRPVADQVSRYARIKSGTGQKSLWKEEDHPRNESGEFAEKGTGSTHSASSEKQAPAETEPTETADASVMTAVEREKYDEYLAMAKSFKLTARSESDWLKTFREQQERLKPKEKEPEQEQTEAETEPTKGTEPEAAEVTSDGSVEDSVPEPEPEPAPTPQSLFSEATAEGDSPREAADKAARVDDPEYEFARQSSIRNAGEDLKGSARHKVNAWRGLAEAEADGTAAEMVTRDNLMKAEPHGLMDHVGKNPLTAMAMHFALKKLPPAPGYGDERRRSRLTDDEKKKDREQFLDAYRSVKSKAEELARTQDDPLKAIGSMRTHVLGVIRKFRGQNSEDSMGAAAASDRYNNTANALVGTLNALGTSSLDARKSTSVIHQMGKFASNMKSAYPDASPDEKREKAIDHASDVIEGASVDAAFGKSSGRGGKRGETFNTAEMYVTHAIRKGGPDLSRETSDPAKATSLMVDRFGMRGVQWGNSVTDDERKHHAKMAAEALADLTDILGIDPADVSLGGKLGLAIGARGHGAARAHYEPGSKVINLTRKAGVGSLAHEWGHAFDHSVTGFRKFESQQYHGQQSEGGLQAAYGKLKREWSNSGYERRLRETMEKMERDGVKMPGGRQYWESPEEKFARSFERYIQHKLSKGGRANTYLAGLGENAYKTGGLWPNETEIAAMTPHFDAIFDAYRKSKGQSGEAKKYSRDELVRYFMQAVDRYEMTPAELEQAQSESSETAPSKRSSRGGKGGKWVKIGGGAPAFVNPDGTIKKGCPGLKGENVDDLIDEPEESRERRGAKQAHAESKGLKGHQVTASEARKWEGQGARRQHDAAKQAADRHGVAVADVLKALPEAHQFLLQEWNRVEKARAEARRRSGMNSSNLGKIENAYRDHSTVKNWDRIAEAFASEVPEMGFGRGGDVGQEVWDFIREGSKPKPQLHSEETADMAAQLVGRRGSGGGWGTGDVATGASGWEEDGDSWEADGGDDSFDPDKFARRVTAAVDRYAQGGLFDEEKHPRDGHGQWTASKKATVPGAQASLFGGDDLKTGQKSLFNVVRPEKSGKKTPADVLAGVTAEVKEILSRKETISPADIAGTSKQAESIEGQKDLFARVRAGVEQYLKRSKI